MYVCLTKQICNHRIACSFSPRRPMPCSVLRMVLLTECSISHHFFSLSFKLLPCSLLLSSPLFSTLHPTTASTDYTGRPNLTVLTTLTASDVISLTFLRGKEALLSVQQMREEGKKKLRDLTKPLRKSARAGSPVWVLGSWDNSLLQKDPFSLVTCKN